MSASQAISASNENSPRENTIHVSLGQPVRNALNFIGIIVALGWFYLSLPKDVINAVQNTNVGATELFAIVKSLVLPILGGIVWCFLVSGVRVAAQWERGIVMFLGKYRATRGPGLVYVIPVIEYIQFVDTRMLVANIPKQKVITKDNVPAEIDSAIFYVVVNPELAVLSVQNYRFAIMQYAQAALRDVVGALSLDELLAEREQIQTRIRENVETHVKEWGIHIDTIRLQDIELPETLKQMMSRQASAEREKRATLTKAEGDRLASENLALAASKMYTSPGAMQLRTLQTLDGLGAGNSNTVILFPLEITEMLLKAAQQAKTE